MNFETIIIFGIGAVGSNTVMNLIYDLPTVDIIVVDMDKVEMRNYSAGTQPYNKNHLNKFKTQALQMEVFARTGKKITFHNLEIKSKKDVEAIIKGVKKEGGILIVDAFDNALSRNYLHDLKGVEILHAGFSPDMTAEVIWDDMWNMQETKKPNTTDICTQQGARSFIMSVTSILCLVITNYYFNGKMDNLYFDKSLNLKLLK